jgi:hypothetical protein
MKIAAFSPTTPGEKTLRDWSLFLRAGITLGKKGRLVTIFEDGRRETISEQTLRRLCGTGPSAAALVNQMRLALVAPKGLQGAVVPRALANTLIPKICNVKKRCGNGCTGREPGRPDTTAVRPKL